MVREVVPTPRAKNEKILELFARRPRAGRAGPGHQDAEARRVEMTEKHKLKKRVRARMDAEGTTYTEALAKEQEAKAAAPKWTLASLRELHRADAAREVMEELVEAEFQSLLEGSESSAPLDAFIDRVCELAVELYAEGSEWDRTAHLISLMDCAVGIDRFWVHDPSQCAPERWLLWSDVRELLKSDASREELRARVKKGVLCGLAATDTYEPVPETDLKLIEKDKDLETLWDSAPDVWEVFGGRPSQYSGGGPTDEPQDRIVVGSLFELPRRTFVCTDEGLAEAAAELQARGPRVAEHFDVEAFKQQKVSNFLAEKVASILRYRMIGKRRAIIEEIVAIDDAGMPNLDFVNEVFAKVVGDEAEDTLRVQLTALLEPKVRTLFRVPAPAE